MDKNGLVWSDMSDEQKESYIDRIRSGSARDLNLSRAFYDNKENDRPHGYEIKDDDLRVADDGLEDTVDALGRLSSLGFDSYSDYVFRLAKSKDPKYKFAAYVIMNGSNKIDERRGWEDPDKVGREKFDQSRFYSGWSNSYHDADWNGLCAVVGFGPTEDIAIKRMSERLTKIVPGDDPSIRRFKLRNMVREGD